VSAWYPSPYRAHLHQRGLAAFARSRYGFAMTSVFLQGFGLAAFGMSEPREPHTLGAYEDVRIAGMRAAHADPLAWSPQRRKREGLEPLEYGEPIAGEDVRVYGPEEFADYRDAIDERDEIEVPAAAVPVLPIQASLFG
jgi:hypothetical protein